MAKAPHQAVQTGGQAGPVDIVMRKDTGDFPKNADRFVKDSLNFVDATADVRAGRNLPAEGIQVQTRRREKLSRFVMQGASDAGCFFLPLLEDLDNDLGQPAQSYRAFRESAFRAASTMLTARKPYLSSSSSGVPDSA